MRNCRSWQIGTDRNWRKLPLFPTTNLESSMESLGIKEATPNFALNNQFLVWVAKKVLGQSDLDLLLTKYYKARLESRLKNRTTHINEDNSTKQTLSTTPTYLPVLVDWISSVKPLSTRPPFPLPTPPRSSLSLTSPPTKFPPSPFTQSTSSVPCCFKDIYSSLRHSVTEPTFLKSNLPPNFHLYVCIKDINQEVMAINIPNAESFPTPPRSRLVILRLCHTREHLLVSSLREPISANFWKNLKIYTTTTGCPFQRKSDAYLGIVRCLPLGISKW